MKKDTTSSTLGRSGFTFYKSYADIYFKLDNPQKIQFIDSILMHQLTNANIDEFAFDDALLDIAWLGIKPNLNSNKVKYINGSKPKDKAKPKRNKAKPKRNGSEMEAKPKPSANNENENENENEKTSKSFDVFWENYPKKINKKLSMVAFGKLGKVDAKLATEDCKVRFVETEKQYIPNPTTYLNGERWNDELADGVAKEKKGYYSGVKWQ
jgi:hypothetical protein